MEGFGERIRKLAEEQKLGRGWQAELAARCGVKPPSVSGWLTGDSKKMEAAHLFATADFFHVNSRWLAFGVGPKTGGADWPFRSITPEQYQQLPPDARSMVEATILTALQLGGSGAAPAKKKRAVGDAH